METIKKLHSEKKKTCSVDQIHTKNRTPFGSRKIVQMLKMCNGSASGTDLFLKKLWFAMSLGDEFEAKKVERFSSLIRPHIASNRIVRKADEQTSMIYKIIYIYILYIYIYTGRPQLGYDFCRCGGDPGPP